MRQLLPDAIDEVDPTAIHAADDRRANADGRPWVVVNMIASADGGTAVDGVSGPLGGPADRLVFAALRAAADGILVGAATVRAERYGPAARRGDRPPARIAVVTASGELDPALPLFGATGGERPLVITVEACPAERRAALAAVAEVVVAGAQQVDLAVALDELATRGLAVVLAEGGPSLNGQLVAADLVDEWCLTLSPTLLAGTAARPAAGPSPADGLLACRLDRLLVEGDLCFVRYLRVRDASTAR